MKVSIKNLIAILLLLSTYNSSYSQHKLELSGQFIPRLEQRHGYRTLAPENSKSAVFISERLRLNFDYENKYIRLFASLQDVRVWGNEEQTKNLGSFGLHEGWAEIYIKKIASVKLGRQEISYDDNRLMGNLDWVQTARSHDALLLKFFPKNAQVHIGGAFNQSGENIIGTIYKLKNYKALAYVWYNHEFDSARTTLSVYGVADGLPTTDSIPKTKFRFTFGPTATFKYNHFNGNIGFYIQTGKHISDKTILAFMANVYAEYTRPKWNLGVGYDYLSGQNNKKLSSNQYHSFHTLYPTNHKFYGHMDYFLDLPTDTRLGGLQDVYLRCNYKPKPKGMIGFDAHYFFTSTKVANPAVSNAYFKMPLGFELDLYGSYKPFPFMEVKAGYSVMAATSTMEYIKPTGSKKAYNGWSFVMLSLKPSFFKWSKEPNTETIN